MDSKKLFQVAIVGRPNVGKSALFNRLAGRKISIVHDQPGVTRDRIGVICTTGDRDYELCDTGGIGADPDPDFARQTHEAARIAIEAADLILFVVDGQDGLTPLDEDVAKQLRVSGKNTVLVVNKIDHEKHEPLAGDFARLGFEQMVEVSAAHGRGVAQLKKIVRDYIPEWSEADEVEKGVPRVAIVGRPNAGKSSLLNRLLGDDRSIVSNLAGTTRDSVDTRYERGGKVYLLTDTAGIRHRSRHNTSVEVFSVMRAERSIRESDLCVLLVDATIGVTSQDKRIAGMIEKAGKAAVVALNKWDLIKPEQNTRKAREEVIKAARQELFFLNYAPFVTLSALSGESVGRLFNEIEKVGAGAAKRLSTGVLNRLVHQAVEYQPPPSRNGRRLKILYATQLEARPWAFDPARFVLFVNDPKLFTDNFRAYLERVIRTQEPYLGLPVQFILRGRVEKERGRK